MAKPNYQAGGSFLPGYPARVTSTDPWNFDVSPTVGTDTGQGAQTLVTNTSTQTLTNKTLTAPTITAPAISGLATLASGAVLTTPSIVAQAADLTSTGTTGSNATSISGVFPAFYSVTGASGAGLNLPTGTAGAFCVMRNMMTGAFVLYAVGSTMNGVTGTTGISVTITGNKSVVAFATAAGAWFVGMNT